MTALFSGMEEATRDPDFIQKLISKDDSAWSLLVKQTRHTVVSIVSKILSGEDVYEAVSDTYVRLTRNIPKFDPVSGTLEAFIFTNARNAAVDIQRKNRHLPIPISQLQTEREVGRISKRSGGVEKNASGGPASTGRYRGDSDVLTVLMQAVVGSRSLHSQEAKLLVREIHEMCRDPKQLDALQYLWDIHVHGKGTGGGHKKKPFSEAETKEETARRQRARRLLLKLRQELSLTRGEEG